MTVNARIAILTLVLGAPAASAHDGQAHTHWWLELGEAAKSWTWSAGAAVAQNRFGKFETFNDGSFTGSDSDRSAVGTRVFGSVGGRYAAFEVGYADAGEATHAAQSDGSSSNWSAGSVSSTLQVEGFDASVVGRIPVGQDWTVLARAGVFKYDTDSEARGNSQCCGTGPFRIRDSGSEALYGLGAEHAFGRWRLGLAYLQTKISDSFLVEDLDLRALSLTAAYAWGPAAAP